MKISKLELLTYVSGMDRSQVTIQWTLTPLKDGNHGQTDSIHNYRTVAEIPQTTPPITPQKLKE